MAPPQPGRWNSRLGGACKRVGLGPPGREGAVPYEGGANWFPEERHRFLRRPSAQARGGAFVPGHPPPPPPGSGRPPLLCPRPPLAARDGRTPLCAGRREPSNPGVRGLTGSLTASCSPPREREFSLQYLYLGTPLATRACPGEARALA